MYFNSQPHEEADTTVSCGLRRMDISTHSLTRRLTRSTVSSVVNRIISTHSLTRRLTIDGSARATWLQISTHSLTRRLTIHLRTMSNQKRHFNSQPHEEADNNLLLKLRKRRISTHSLTRRLTRSTVSSVVNRIISTHSLTRRLTNFHNNPFILIAFQLTASRGG